MPIEKKVTQNKIFELKGVWRQLLLVWQRVVNLSKYNLYLFIIQKLQHGVVNTQHYNVKINLFGVHHIIHISRSATSYIQRLKIRNSPLIPMGKILSFKCSRVQLRNRICQTEPFTLSYKQSTVYKQVWYFRLDRAALPDAEVPDEKKKTSGLCFYGWVYWPT